MGSWALYGPPSYALVAGITGIVFYSLASGIPILVVAFLGDILQKKLPGILSLSDYTYKRFGR
jgi:Na+/proline symporter